MQCPACGAQNRDGAPFCLTCRATIPALDASAARAAPPPAQPAWATPYVEHPVEAVVANRSFAGFWSRFLAWVLDAIFSGFLAIVPAVIVAVLLAVAVSAGQSSPADQFERDSQDSDALLAAVVGFLVVYVPIFVGYHTVANATGGGWGKRIMRLRIVRERDGARPGYGTGFLRAVAPFFIGIVPIVGGLMRLLDYLWMLWDADKQTLHDKIAGTVVIQV